MSDKIPMMTLKKTKIAKLFKSKRMMDLKDPPLMLKLMNFKRNKERKMKRKTPKRKREFLKNPTQKIDNLDPSTMELYKRINLEREVLETLALLRMS